MFSLEDESKETSKRCGSGSGALARKHGLSSTFHRMITTFDQTGEYLRNERHETRIGIKDQLAKGFAFMIIERELGTRSR